ncbi:hypothetical protein DDB_G0287329 [Dictyostelium discoideum AX4]|uniref:Putative uncharacterized transmembrane protein DDB_G0287329 n=1 Tax=Dictyostelium discoideum TaxID=44689 RepID=Y7423_DICDI|nr:hypothetical protein DDB_G0287329 [Dictyostelium discoideum AX4]Q54KI2.1 RecName: Full=Putative uncharacterized transmembrane protein DDB_G0287329; Flags: Precursor [Dictyostelium discoideum]EAL63732.1 hypothetical protein DDB_G0287329 [Dictyostelium discoideum AX4]|eukprot:XP_637241.1 hypothetical protein DDB_G0287329 [Dictyostelium discoideum AX4]
MQSNFIFATLLVLLSLLTFTYASGSSSMTSSSMPMFGGAIVAAFAFAIFSRLAQNFAPRAIFSLLPYHSVSC